MTPLQLNPSTRLVFGKARQLVKGDGVFSPEQGEVLFQMLDMIEEAVEREKETIILLGGSLRNYYEEKK